MTEQLTNHSVRIYREIEGRTNLSLNYPGLMRPLRNITTQYQARCSCGWESKWSSNGDAIRSEGINHRDGIKEYHDS
jgi:hypothetical protein